MKIIAVDNFDRDTKSDVLIAEHVNSSYAYHITKALNEKFGGVHSQIFFRLVGDNYKLYKFVP